MTVLYPNMCCIKVCYKGTTVLDSAGNADCLFVCVDALHPSQQFFSHVRTISCLPGLNQY